MQTWRLMPELKVCVLVVLANAVVRMGVVVFDKVNNPISPFVSQFFSFHYQ
jgi:hypothetical protein